MRNQYENHLNGQFAAEAILLAMIEERNRSITRLQTGNTRRGLEGADRDAVESLKQERDALEFALSKL